jgi:general secretion pathway protein K
MRGHDGFALIGALWLLVVISAVGLEFGLESRSRRWEAMNRLEEPKARAAARAGIAHARAQLEGLLEGRNGGGRFGNPARSLDSWTEASSILPETIRLADTAYRVTVEDVGAKLNLNLAAEDEIRRLLEALRVDAGRADRIAQSVLDWRDPDDLHRARGAEREWYERQGSPVLPRNGPFRSLPELLHVKDVTPDSYERVLPYLTLEGSGRVNLQSAERPVLLALPGMTEEVVSVVMRWRRSGAHIGSVANLMGELSPRAQEVFEASLPQLLSRTTVETKELEILSEGWVDGGRIHVRETAYVVREDDTSFLVSVRVE